MAVQTLTYEDKQFLNQNSDIADVNKVNDTDMNEIKSVVNNNAQEVTNITGQILWTNPNPTSSFSAQTITLNSSEYDMLEFYFKGGTTGTTMFSEKTLKGYNTIVNHIVNLNAGVSQPTGVRQRQATYVNDTTYTITDALTRDGGSASEPVVENQRLIPLYVIGYKTGLFN